MADTDEEQIEELKVWWKENGNSLVITVVVTLAIVFGFRAWQNSVADTAAAASVLYENIATAVGNAPVSSLSDEVLSSTRALGNQLKTDYADSTYAHFGAFYMAKIAVEKREYETAEFELMWVLENNVSELLEPVARMRLASVLAAQNRADEGLLALAVEIELGAHAISWHETQGDILYQMGNTSDARAAYQTAADLLGDAARPLLKAKLQDLTVLE